MTDAALLACSLSQWRGDRKRCRWCNAPLEGRKLRWCSDACPEAMLENHYWPSVRAVAIERDKGRCRGCGCTAKTRRLEVHHRDERAMGRHGKSSCVHHLAGVETQCERCHRNHHRARAVA